MAPRKKQTVHFEALAPANMRLDRDRVMKCVLGYVNQRFTGIPLNKSDLAGFDGLSRFPDQNVFEFRIKQAALKARHVADNARLVLTLKRSVPAEWTVLVPRGTIAKEFKRIRRNLLARLARGEMGSEKPYAYVSRQLELKFPHLQFTSFHTVEPAGVAASALTRFLCWYEGKPMDMEVFHPNQRNPFV